MGKSSFKNRPNTHRNFREVMFFSGAQLIFKDEGLMCVCMCVYVCVYIYIFRDHMLNSKTNISKFKYLH